MQHEGTVQWFPAKVLTHFLLLGLGIPFLLLPFRPSSDPSAARTFIRNFFNAEQKGTPLQGDALMQELRLTEPMVR